MGKNHILIVEDEKSLSQLIQSILAEQGFTVTAYADAETAWAHIQRDCSFNAILLDRGLPGMDGMALLQLIKADNRFRQIPVIFETGMDDIAQIQEGLAAGAYYYLTKPLEPALMIAVLSAAVRQFGEYQSLLQEIQVARQALHFLHAGTFKIRTVNEAEELARGLAYLCPDPSKAVYGLHELLLNAVEHGNLGISYEEKKQLLIRGCWAEEVRKRQADEKLGQRHVRVSVTCGDRHIEFTIEDEGLGFTWQQYLEFSPERAFDPHGRGIAIAGKLSFDSVEYHGTGSSVTATVALGR